MVIKVTDLIVDLETEKMGLLVVADIDNIHPLDVRKLQDIDEKLTRLYRWVGKVEYEDLAKRANY